MEQYTEIVPLLVGFFMPAVIELINRDVHDVTLTIKGRVIVFPQRLLKFIVSVLACVVVALALNFRDIRLGSWAEVEQSFLILFAASKSVYTMWFKGSNAQQLLQRKPTLTPAL